MPVYIPSLSEAYRKAKYNWNYLLIDARLRYYSNSSNPRVVHTKFSNQPLLSLRTYPHDKYFVKQGEFLTLARKDDNDIVSFLDCYNEASLASHANPTQYCMPGLPTQYCTPGLFEVVKLSEGEWRPLASDRLHDWFRTQVPKEQTDKIMARAHERKKELVGKMKMRLRAKVGSATDKEEQLIDMPLSPVTSKSEGHMLELARVRFEGDPNQRCKCAKCDEKKIWQTVLNDVSLSAARLSTGSECTDDEQSPMHSPKNSPKKGAKRDVFAENYRQGRTRFFERCSVVWP